MHSSCSRASSILALGRSAQRSRLAFFPTFSSFCKAKRVICAARSHFYGQKFFGWIPFVSRISYRKTGMCAKLATAILFASYMQILQLSLLQPHSSRSDNAAAHENRTSLRYGDNNPQSLSAGAREAKSIQLCVCVYRLAPRSGRCAVQTALPMAAYWAR